MTPIFTINFRREIYLRQRARSRARLFALGGWLLYFGLLGVVLGLYGLNCASLTRRTRQVERQASRLESAQGPAQDWVVDEAQLAAVERFHLSPKFWRDKLARLSALLPVNVALTEIAVNPDNLTAPADLKRMVLTGQLRATAGQDPMRAIVQLVATLQKDPVFGSGYHTIKLSQSRMTPGEPAATEFVIECR